LFAAYCALLLLRAYLHEIGFYTRRDARGFT
jgi:hypothetical protein